MRGPRAIFLDDGGVLNDNRVRSQQWKALVGEFFTHVLGGRPDAWADANHRTMTTILEPGNWTARIQSAGSYADFDRAYSLDWLRAMCELVGVVMPPDDEAFELAQRAYRRITPQVRSAFPGAVEAVEALHAAGYPLFTASGESSIDLEGYLTGMGVRDYFERLYGPDLVDTLKAGPEYYIRIFDDAGIRPDEALVVDDSPTVLSWVVQVGAAGVLVGDMTDRTGYAGWIRSLSELPPFLSTG